MKYSLPGRRSIGLLVLLLVASSQFAFAQNEVPPVTNVFAIQGATVVTQPGTALTNATVVVRNGLIESVGQTVEVPYDAKVIRGDSLFVYAGFIDGLGYIGIPEPRSNAGQGDAPDDPGNPTNEQAGIQPERSAADLLDSSDKSVAAFREAGFAIAHVVPRGRMLPGSGSIVSLTDQIDAGVIRNDVSMFMQFEGAGRVYPRTPMGIMAKFRNLYRQAELEKTWTANYQTNPSGIQRPPNTPAHMAFFSAIDGKQPIFMNSDDALTTYRAMRLQKDLGFSLVLTGVGQASEMVQELADSGEEILLTLKLPKEPDSKKKGDSAKKDTTDAETPEAGPAETAKTFNPDLRTTSYADVEAEAANLNARKMQTYNRYVETAAALEKAGVSFGFSTADIDAKDFRKNLIKMIEVGLSSDAALAALTTNPATILGISKSAGTVSSGKLANLVVSSGDYFKEKSFVQYMIVDGSLHEYEAPKASKSKGDGDEANAEAVGDWRYLTDVDGVSYQGRFTLSNDNGSLSGTIAGDNLPRTSLFDIVLDGSSLSFGFDIPDLGSATMSGSIDDGSGTATITLPGLGSFPASLHRTSTPD